MQRRTFLKGMLVACATPALAIPYVPPKEIIPKEIIISTTSYLDNLVDLIGIHRTPGETDASLRERALAKFSKPTYTYAKDARVFIGDQELVMANWNCRSIMA